MSTATLKLLMSITWSVSNCTSNSSSMAAIKAMWPTESQAPMSRYFRFSTSTSSSSWRASTNTVRSRSLIVMSPLSSVVEWFAVGPHLEQGSQVLRDSGRRQLTLALEEGLQRGYDLLGAAAAAQPDHVDA